MNQRTRCVGQSDWRSQCSTLSRACCNRAINWKYIARLQSGGLCEHASYSLEPHGRKQADPMGQDEQRISEGKNTSAVFTWLQEPSSSAARSGCQMTESLAAILARFTKLQRLALSTEWLRSFDTSFCHW